MKMLLLFVLVLGGCVSVPIEHRYYSHRTKSALQLPGDRQLCAIQVYQIAAHKGKTIILDWSEIDACLRRFGWENMYLQLGVKQ